MGARIRHAGRVLTSSRSRAERGASLVEFAIILPVFMVLVLGMFSGGVAYNRQIAIRNAAREGARYGSILPQGSGTGTPTWAELIQTQVVERSEGELTAADVCVALVNFNSPTAVVSPAAHYSTTGAPCFADGGADGKRRVQVSVRASATIEGLVFSYPLTLTSESIARYEPPS
jgi:Flp pilus assembly protein TadG